MARTGGGRSDRRRRSVHRVLNRHEDESFSGDKSERNNRSSGFDEMCSVSRDMLLVDALFSFFRDQSVKTLKRNFSDFCQDFDLTSNIKKKCRVDGIDRNAFTKFSLKYFLVVIRKLTQQQRDVIKKFGFGCLLLLDLQDIPSEFARWVADRVDPVCSQMTVQSSTINLSERTVHAILGLPIGGLDILCDSKEGEEFILGHFKLSAMPHITFFGNKLGDSVELSEHDVFVCFMCIALHCFLCPSSKDYISGKYLAVLKHPESAKGCDYSKLVYDHCLSNIKDYITACKLKCRSMRSPVCCNYVLVVRYLDCLDFGRKNVDQSHPRISVWVGNMIRSFSELDRKRRNKYGKRPVKECFATCRRADVKYSSPFSSPFQCFTPDFRNKLQSCYGSNLRTGIVDGIVDIAENVALIRSTTSKQKQQLLVNRLLEFLCKSRSNMNPPGQKAIDDEPIFELKKSAHTDVNAADSNTCKEAVTFLGGDFQNLVPTTKNARDDVSQGETNLCNDPNTPECLITKVTGPIMTAPPMKVLKKVKSRKCHVISIVDEENLLTGITTKTKIQGNGTFIDLSPATQPILVDSPCVKPCTGDFNIRRCNPVEGCGSKKVPFLVGEVSPITHRIDGSNDFKRRCSELAKKNDNTYNNMLSKQTLQNSRFPVSDDDIINYSAIIELGHSDAHMKTMGVLYPEVHCNYQSIGESLKPEGEVDNFLLTCFYRLLFKEKHPAVSGRHYFFPHIGDAILKYQDFPNDSLIRNTFEGAAKASKGRNLGSPDNRLFFPIVNSGHWFVFGVDFKYKLFVFLDSFHDKGSDFHVRKKDTLIDNFIHVWELFVSQNENFGEFRAMYPHVPKQGTSMHDCGVFCMKFMELWKPDVDMRKLFSSNDIMNIRIQYAIKLYFQSHNETDMSLVTDYYNNV